MRADEGHQVARQSGAVRVRRRAARWLVRAGLAVCLVIATAVGAAQPAGAHPGSGGSTHSFDLTGTIKVVDTDWPDSDDVRTFGFTGFSDTTTTPPGSYVNARLSQSEFCVDEVRVELDVFLRLQSDGGAFYYAHATMFEGTSCGTTDRDGSASGGVYALPVGVCHQHSFTVRNTDDGGDHATVTIRIEQDHQPFLQHC